MITVTADITIPPDTLARAFWTMASDQQVEFFAELAKVIKADHIGGNPTLYSLGELHWFFLEDDLMRPENRVARDMLMTMAAPLYLHTLRASGVSV